MTESSSTAAERFRIAMDLFQTGVDLMRQNLRREHPDDSDEEIEARLADWLKTRPGAEHGDCPGRRLDWPIARR